MYLTAENKQFIERCFDLAKLGAIATSPNPMVGALLEHENRIIGEGYHRLYGSDHAEVDCIKSVKKEDQGLIKDATLYISLEPCCIIGNTPACTVLIQKHNIKRVIYSSIDPTPGVNGQSKIILEKAGSSVTTGINKEKGDQLIRFRSVIARHKRPYVILKFAKSSDGFIGKKDEQIWLSNSYTKTLSHKWRSEVDAILVGTNTAKVDNPRLNNRFYFGKSPLRIVLDRKLQLDSGLHIMDNSTPSWIIYENKKAKKDLEHLKFIQIPFDEYLIPGILQRLFENKKGILLVEGGSQLLQSFIDLNLWDEARVFETDTFLGEGIEAPKINRPLSKTWYLKNNTLKLYFNPS